MYMQAPMGPHVGAWYDNWGDFTGDISNAAQWIVGRGRAGQQFGTQIQNTGNNLSNLTSARVDLTTVLLGGVALLVVIDMLERRRR